MDNLDPSLFFTNSNIHNTKNLNQSTTIKNSTLEDDMAKSLLKSKKTSSLIFDGLEESSILFDSKIGNPSDSVVEIDLNNMKECTEQQNTRANNRRQTMQIFKQNREMARLEEQARLEEVGKLYINLIIRPNNV